MAFIGAIINAAKGIATKTNNSMIISDLEDELKKDLLEGLTEDEKIEAEIKLKEAELEISIINKKSRNDQSKIEREIIDLMEAKLKRKMEDLKQKEATQLDIAKTMISIQKISNDMKDYIKKMDNELIEKTNEFSSTFNENTKLFENKINNRFKNYDSKLNTILADIKSKSEKINEINSILNGNINRLDIIENLNDLILSDLKTERMRIDKIEKVIQTLKQNIDKNSEVIEKNQQMFNKHKTICTALYIVTVLVTGTSLWYFVIR